MTGKATSKAEETGDRTGTKKRVHSPAARPRGRPPGSGGGPRLDNRRIALMDAAAKLFADKGYSATTIRDIASAAGMLPGSVYYHFPSKTTLLLEIYRDGVGGLARRVDAAVAAAGGEAWARLEAAAVAHLETVLDQSAYAKVMIRVLPDHAEDAEVSAELAAARDAYERRFRKLVGALPLTDETEPAQLRLMLLGALNWTQNWYRGDGSPPAEIARGYVQSLKQGVSP